MIAYYHIASYWSGWDGWKSGLRDLVAVVAQGGSVGEALELHGILCGERRCSWSWVWIAALMEHCASMKMGEGEGEGERNLPKRNGNISRSQEQDWEEMVVRKKKRLSYWHMYWAVKREVEGKMSCQTMVGIFFFCTFYIESNLQANWNRAKRSTIIILTIDAPPLCQLDTNLFYHRLTRDLPFGNLPAYFYGM